MWRSTATCGFSVMLLTCSPALAQDRKEPNRWGVVLSVAPSWKVPDGVGLFRKLAEVSLESADVAYDIAGADFRIGIVRGRRGHGDWGLSIVRRTFDEDSTQGVIVTQCIQQVSCFVRGKEYHLQDAIVSGIEANKFFPFATVRNVLRVGVDLAAGLGWHHRTVERRDAFNQFTETSTEAITGFSSTRVPASELSHMHPTILGRAELAAAVLLTPRLNVRVSGGMNYPGANFGSVALLYFFGGHQYP